MKQLYQFVMKSAGELSFIFFSLTSGIMISFLRIPAGWELLPVLMWVTFGFMFTCTVTDSAPDFYEKRKIKQEHVQYLLNNPKSTMTLYGYKRNSYTANQTNTTIESLDMSLLPKSDPKNNPLYIESENRLISNRNDINMQNLYNTQTLKR